MASDTKTPVEVARELTKALGEKIEALRKDGALVDQVESASVPSVQHSGERPTHESEQWSGIGAPASASPTHEMEGTVSEQKPAELPQSPEEAIGGQQESGSVPSMPKQAGGTTNAEMQKDEIVAQGKAKCPGCGRKSAPSAEGASGRKLVTLCDSCKKKNVGNVKKMALPQSPEKASGGQVNKSELDALDVAQALAKTVVEKIAQVREELVKMEKLEAAGNEKLQKGIGTLPSSTPSEKQIADGDPHKMVEQRNIFSIMAKGEGKFEPWKKGSKKPKVGKEVSAGEGSGGSDTTRPGPSLAKQGMPMSPPKAPALKPAGVPGAKSGEAPKAPAAPKAAGASGATMKMELPHSPEKAKGGQMSSGSVPTDVTITGNSGPALEKGDLPTVERAKTIARNIKGDGSEKDNLRGQGRVAPKPNLEQLDKQPAKKMELPQSPEKAKGGQMSSGSVPSVSKQAGGTTDAEMKKDMKPMSPVFANKIGAGAAVPPSPVFHNSVGGSKTQAGGSFGASGVQITTALPTRKPAAAAMHAAGPGTGSDMKTVADTISNKTVAMRSPPISKAEMDSAKCPKCGDGMTLCKCSHSMK